MLSSYGMSPLLFGHRKILEDTDPSDSQILSLRHMLLKDISNNIDESSNFLLGVEGPPGHLRQ